MAAAITAKVVLEAATYAIDKPKDYRVRRAAGRALPGMRVIVPSPVQPSCED